VPDRGLVYNVQTVVGKQEDSENSWSQGNILYRSYKSDAGFPVHYETWIPMSEVLNRNTADTEQFLEQHFNYFQLLHMLRNVQWEREGEEDLHQTWQVQRVPKCVYCDSAYVISLHVNVLQVRTASKHHGSCTSFYP